MHSTGTLKISRTVLLVRMHGPRARGVPAASPTQLAATARTGILGIPRTVLRAASTAVAECSCTGMTLATGSPQLDNTISKPYCLFPN